VWRIRLVDLTGKSRSSYDAEFDLLSVRVDAMCVLRGRGVPRKEPTMKNLHNENETTAATANLSTEAQAPAVVAKPARIEAYGSKGMQSRAWRRTFASAEKLLAWCERNDAVVLGTRRVEGEQERTQENAMSADHTNRQSKMLFAVGSTVTSRVNAQGLKEGHSYTVEAALSRRNFLGTYLTVAVRDGEEVHYVGHPSLVLQPD